MTRRRNKKRPSREELLRRRMQRGDSALVHGICRECSRRRILIQPARLCERCLLSAADDYTPPTADEVLADPFMEGDDDVAVS